MPALQEARARLAVAIFRGTNRHARKGGSSARAHGRLPPHRPPPPAKRVSRWTRRRALEVVHCGREPFGVRGFRIHGPRGCRLTDPACGSYTTTRWISAPDRPLGTLLHSPWSRPSSPRRSGARLGRTAAAPGRRWLAAASCAIASVSASLLAPPKVREDRHMSAASLCFVPAGFAP